MCGRYTLTATPGELVGNFDIGALTFDYFARFNIAPGQACPVIARDSRGRRMGLLHWGLIPGWRDEPGPGFINARSESVSEKPSFREAFLRRRCLVPADGFYEWERRAAGDTEPGAVVSSGGKTPHWIYPRAGGVLSLAGVWETWSRPGATTRNTFAILTTEASEDVRLIHDRMPVVIDAGRRDAWLARDTAPDQLLRLMAPAPAETFTSRVVSTRVNRVAEDDSALIEPVTG